LESHPGENSPKLPNKPITFLDIPTEDIAYFIDKVTDSYFLRLETMSGRVIIPLGDEFENKLGGLVDDYFTYLG